MLARLALADQRKRAAASQAIAQGRQQRPRAGHGRTRASPDSASAPGLSPAMVQADSTTSRHRASSPATFARGQQAIVEPPAWRS